MTALTASSCRRASSPPPRTLGRLAAIFFAGAAFTVFFAPALTMCAVSARGTRFGQRRPLPAARPEIARRNTPRHSYAVCGEGGRMDVWQILRDRLDYASFVPAPRAAVDRADLRRRDGTPYTMLKNPHGDNVAGRLAFTRIGATRLVGFGLYGLWLWFQEVRDPKLQLLTIEGSYVLGILALIVLQVISISVHEAGHALAIRHYKRHVRRFGFA